MLCKDLDLPHANVLPDAMVLAHAGEEAGRESAIRRELTAAYDEYAPSLLRYAKALAPSDPDAARDAVQETFFRFFISRREGNAIHNERAWLFAVLRNVVADRLRSLETSRAVPLDQVQPAVDPTADMERAASLDALSRKLPSLLSERELDCVRLRSEGLRYEEIGLALNLQCGTVGALIARAMTKLRRAMGVAPR